MKKYLIFTMLLLTVLACKSKQKPGGGIGSGGGGGTIDPPAVIRTEDEHKIESVFTNMVGNNDSSVNGWQNSDWINEPILTGKDIGKITDGGFFVANYDNNKTWMVFAVNDDTNRDVYLGMSQGYGNLQEAMNTLVDTNTRKFREASWDPRKVVYNYDGDNGQLNIAWLGRAMWGKEYGDQNNTSYKDFDEKYPNALKYLKVEARTYGTLRNYQSIPFWDFLPDLELREREGFHHPDNSTTASPIESTLSNLDRRVWGYIFTGPSYGGGKTIVSSREGTKFAYAGSEGGYLSDIGTDNTANTGGKIRATPPDAKLADKDPVNGKYYNGYKTTEPRGKIVFNRVPDKADGNRGTRVLFLSVVVAQNIRMRDSTNASGLFDDKYNVKEVIFEFDASTFADIQADNFAGSDLPIREKTEGGVGTVDPSLEIKPGSQITTHKIPLLYFSPKPK